MSHDAGSTFAWREAFDVLERLLGLDDAARETELQSLAGARPALHRHVVTLIEADREARASVFLGPEPPAGMGIPEMIAIPAPGVTIGPYRLERSLGAGGMGEVWLARRADGLFETPVAVKLLHAHLSGSSARERFVREGRILGQLTHPHVARLVDAGITPTGQLFLALEYIEGRRIDEWCEEHRIGIEERLALFLKLCLAVSHAHAHLVVHRDLKPSNVMVSDDGELKLLDFGIAKLVEDAQGATFESEATRIGGRAFTPQYAAPEQVDGGPVSVATDVYSLGVLLYGLLCGHHPYAENAPTLAEIERAVRDTVPRPPSERLADPGSAGLAAARGTSIPRLRRRLRGDLDTIVSKALKKASPERYASVAAMADDIRRHLDLLPILARPDALSYRAARFARRHRLLLAATAAVVVAMTSGLAVALWQAQAATSARNDATARREQADHLINFMLVDLRDRLQAVGRVDLLDAVSNEAARYVARGNDADLDDAALAERVRARMALTAVADTMNDVARSASTIAAAVDAARELVRRHPDDPEALILLASALQAQVQPSIGNGRDAQARALVDEGRRLVARALAVRPGDPQGVSVEALFHGFSGYLEDRVNATDRSAQEYLACAERIRPLAMRPDARSDDRYMYSNCKGTAAARTAVRSLETSIALFQDLLADIRTWRAARPGDMVIEGEYHGNLALASETYAAAARFDLAVATADEAVEIGRRIVAHDPANGIWAHSLTMSIYTRCRSYQQARRWSDAVAICGEAVDRYTAEFGTPARDTDTLAMTMSGHLLRARALAALGNVDQAVAEYREVVAMAEGQDDPQVQLQGAGALLGIVQRGSMQRADQTAFLAAARDVLARIETRRQNLSADRQNLLDGLQMVFAYLSGDPAAGDRLYPSVVAGDAFSALSQTRTRRELCARLASGPGPRCADLEEWEPPPAAPPRVAQDGRPSGTPSDLVTTP